MKKSGKSRPAGKIVTLNELIAIAKAAHKASKKIVTTNGCFDILHVGHMRALSFARACGDLLIVGINADASVRKNKGKSRPIVPQRERAEMLSALECVNYVFIFNTKTPDSWLKVVRPHVHVKSSDYTLEQVQERHVVHKHGGKVVLFPHTKKHSTSKIISKIRSL